MNEELQQQLMEFAYGLLEEDEAGALSERITSDPQVARAYAKVKLQCDLVGLAAIVEAPNVAWNRPEGNDSSSAGPQAASRDWSAAGYRRLANWCIGVAASGLICLVGSSYLLSSRSAPSAPSRVAMASTKPVHVVLTGPSKLHSEASNPFTIHVKTHAGTPVSTRISYSLYDTSGAVAVQDAALTDQSGIAHFDVDAAIAGKASHLEVTTGDDSRAPIQLGLETAPEQFVTYLRMDRPLYQPGEDVKYRSVTLSRFGLQSEREETTLFEIVNSNDEQVEGTASTVDTEDGVAWGEFELPSELPAGTYTLIARSPDDSFREEWRDFQVRRYEAPRLHKKLELAQDSYTAGDQVDFDFSVKRMAGEPLAELPLQIQAAVDGAVLDAPQAKTDAAGNSRFAVKLPDSIERGEASVSVLVRDGENPPETITKEIPINLGKVNVDFYPEGGNLGAGLPSRVYFYGRDPLGKPTHIEGRLVDSKGDEVARVVTGHEGRGVFSFTPVGDEQYRLMLEKPVGVAKEIPLPPTSPTHFATIETGDGVFGANAPITFTLNQQNPAKPLIVAAYCRGAEMVGQRTIEPYAYSVDPTKFATFRGELDLPPQAQGVVRLTVFDATPTPPEPIVERLVYRRIGQQLDVRLTTDAETFVPGQSVELEVEVRNENNIEVPAVLGVAVVDDAILNLADDKSTRMPTYFHLLTAIDSPQQLEDANFYLSDSSESVAALDSLLGTQGWRRFRHLPEAQLAQIGRGGLGGGGFGEWFDDGDSSRRFRSLAFYGEAAVPLSTAMTMDVHEISDSQFPQAARAASWRRESFASPIIVASIVLLVLIGAASLLWANSNRALRVIAGIVAVASLLVGVASLRVDPRGMDEATASASPAAAEVAVAFDTSETADANDEMDMLWGKADAKKTDPFMFQADAGQRLPATDDAPMEAAPTDPKLLEQLNAAPNGLDRVTRMQKQRRRQKAAVAEAWEDDKDAESSLNKEKKSGALSRDEGPMTTADKARPAAPQPTAEAPSVRSLSAQPQYLGDEVRREILTREYASWFYRARSNIPETDPSSTTIGWYPHHQARLTGKASVHFNLPQHPSSFRAIVEAHGEGRLGSAELLIDSR